MDFCDTPEHDPYDYAASCCFGAKLRFTPSPKHRAGKDLRGGSEKCEAAGRRYLSESAKAANAASGSEPRYLNWPTTAAPFASNAFAILLRVEPVASL